MGPRTAEENTKAFSDIFAEAGLRITAQSNLKVVNVLDITLNPPNGKHYPYRKHDNPPLYINTQSNHAPSIIKQLPATISNRILSISCDSTEFDKVAPVYNNALRSRGFTERLNYIQPDQQRKRRNRPRKTLWFNPPYSMNVQTNIGRHFLQLVDKHFPNGHVLYKIFNSGNCKVSHSCMDNLATIIKKQKSLNQMRIPSTRNAIAQKSPNARWMGNVWHSIVYKATVTLTNREPKAYIGMTESNFKSRFLNHKQSFNNKQYSSSTALSKYIRELKESNDEYSINWSIIKRVNAYKAGAKHYNLCLADKSIILNKRSLS